MEDHNHLTEAEHEDEDSVYQHTLLILFALLFTCFGAVGIARFVAIMLTPIFVSQGYVPDLPLADLIGFSAGLIIVALGWKFSTYKPSVDGKA